MQCDTQVNEILNKYKKTSEKRLAGGKKTN